MCFNYLLDLFKTVASSFSLNLKTIKSSKLPRCFKFPKETIRKINIIIANHPELTNLRTSSAFSQLQKFVNLIHQMFW